MEYFKNISASLSKKYPDKKVYVISDEHFDHKNIVTHTRKDLFGSDDIDNSVNKMNDYIISNHNSVVNDDDIVLILGDFSFKTGIDRLTELISELNGHKFLVMGNHDNIEKPDFYLKAGFEDIFLNPIKFNGDYYSHYPLNSDDDRPNTILYKYLREEFRNSDSGINFHGHQHTLINNGEREKNVSCELVDYKPLLVGRTKSYLDKDLPYINEELFDVIHEIMAKYNHYQENNLVTDYLYTILLELLSPYKDQIVAFGSLMMNKKYNTNFNPSDLDITKLYDTDKATKTNKKAFMKFGRDIYEKMVQVEGFNPDFYKKIDFICILSFLYISKNYRIKGYMDMHMLFDEFYKSKDFININGTSQIEEIANKSGIKTPSTIKYPRFNIQTTNALADAVNSFLLYTYTTDKDKKILSLKKLNKVMDKIDISSQEDFDELQNMLIRFLLRNLYFYERSRRKTESDIVLEKRDIIIPQLSITDNNFKESLEDIVNNQEYQSILNSIQNSNDRKEEITRILKQYK